MLQKGDRDGTDFKAPNTDALLIPHTNPGGWDVPPALVPPPQVHTVQRGVAGPVRAGIRPAPRPHPLALCHSAQVATLAIQRQRVAAEPHVPQAAWRWRGKHGLSEWPPQAAPHPHVSAVIAEKRSIKLQTDFSSR